MKRSVIFRASFLLISGFCVVLLYLMASYTFGTDDRRELNQQSSQLGLGQQQVLLSDAELGNSFIMDTSEGNDGPRKYVEQKLIHLDLKGMPLLPHYLEQVFPLLKKLGATGLLIEYEDMFPFEDFLKPISAKDAYTKEDILYLNKLAENNDLEVIPLVQTFGHMEYVMKLEKFFDLREEVRFPSVICPSRNMSQVVIKAMIDQIISLHPNIKHLHVGCDEVYYLGICKVCVERRKTQHIDKPQIFLDHVKFVANYVKETYNPVRVLMWDDEFRKLDEDAILRSEIGQLVDIVVWNYDPHVQNYLGPNLWQKYAKIFDSIWMGSAFKGANKPDSVIVNETQYLANHFAWIGLAKEQSSAIKFKGMILTGWQRYDHFSIPCEIFPVAIPSLAACLTYVSSTKFMEMNEVFSISNFILSSGSSPEQYSFPGSDVFDAVKMLHGYQTQFLDMKQTPIFRGWVNDYNIKRRFSNPALLDSVYLTLTDIRSRLRSMKIRLENSFSKVFPASSVKEWMSINYEPLYNDVDEIYKMSTRVLEAHSFPVRPLDVNVSDAIQ